VGYCVPTAHCVLPTCAARVLGTLETLLHSKRGQTSRGPRSIRWSLSFHDQPIQGHDPFAFPLHKQRVDLRLDDALEERE